MALSEENRAGQRAVYMYNTDRSSVWRQEQSQINDAESSFVSTGPNMLSSKRAWVEWASSAKEAWWSDGCSVASPTAPAPPTAPAGTAPTFNSPGRKRAKPSRGGCPQRTPPSTVNGSPIVSVSSPLSKRCNRFRERRVATSCTLKNPNQWHPNPGIWRLPLDNPGLSEHPLRDMAQNHLIFQGFSRCQKVATPKSPSPQIKVAYTRIWNVNNSGDFHG